jgi:hypothetical protein
VSDDLRAALRRLPDEWEHTGHLRSAGTDMGARANNEQVDREVEALREWVDAALAAAEPVRDPGAQGVDRDLMESARELAGQNVLYPQEIATLHKSILPRLIAALAAAEPVRDPTVCEVCGELADGEPGRCHRHFRHADAAPPAGIDALDVERLHSAIRAVWSAGHSDLRSGLTTGGMEGSPDPRLAAALAAEYARLTPDRAGRDEGQ